MSTETTPRSAAKPEITAWLVDWIARELQMSAADIDSTRSLLQYSLSSVTATILVGDLEDRFDLRLPPTLVWDYPSIESIADFLVERLTGDADGAHAAQPESHAAGEAPLAVDIDALSDAEVEALLKQLQG